MIYSKKITCLMLIFLFSLTLSGAANAQNIDSNKLEKEIEWTDQIISRAREIVKESRSQKARVTLDKALSLQNSAKNNRNVNDPRKITLSFNLTMEARNQANRAIALAKTETRMLERHRSVFERTRERLANLNGRLIESGTKDMRTRKLARDAKALLEKSHTNITQMRNQLALNLALKAQEMVGKAETRFRKANNLREMCHRRLSLMESLIPRAANRIEGSANHKNKDQLGMAENQFEKAKSLFREGRYNTCRMTLIKSEKSMRSLLANIGPADENSIQLTFKQTWRFYERTRETLEKSRKSSGQQLLNEAEMILKKAEKNIKNGNPDEARKLITRARSLLRKALAASEPEFSLERITARLEKLEAKNTDTRITIEKCSQSESATLYKRAVRHLNKAREHLKNNQLKSADAEIRITNNLFDRINEICSI